MRIKAWGRIGAAGAVTIYAGLASLWAFAVPLFVPADEKVHVDYAYQLSHGHLPEAGTPYHAVFASVGQTSGNNYVAYHPPFYYALIAPLIRLGAESSHPRIWLWAVRGFGIALTMASLVLMFVLVRKVFAHWSPARRTQLAVLATGLYATVPSALGATASIQNDALEMLFVVAAGVILAEIVRTGMTWPRLLALGTACGLGMFSRVSYVQVLITALLTIAFLALRREPSAADKGVRARLGPALLRVLPVAALPVLIAGWFYALNYHRYHSFSADNVATHLVAYRHLQDRMSNPFIYSVHPKTWWSQFLQMGGSLSTDVDHPERVAVVVAIVLIVTLAVGLFAIVRRWNQVRLDRDAWILYVGLFLILLISFAEIASHVTQKGSENNRYLIDALPFWGITMGAAAIAILPRRMPVFGFVVLAAQILGSVWFTLTIVRRQTNLVAGLNPLEQFSRSLDHANVPAPKVVLALLLLIVAVGFVAVCASIVALGHNDDDAAVSAPDAPAPALAT